MTTHTTRRITQKPRLWSRPLRVLQHLTMSALLGFTAFTGLSTVAVAQEAPELQLTTANGQRMPAMTMDMHADVEVSGLVAEVRIRQRFVNHTSQWVEGRYLLPLPETSAVHGLTVQLNDRTIEGEIKEKQEALVAYEAAAAEGKTAALMAQNRPNLFSTRVANIAPGEQVDLLVSYWQRVDRVDDRYQLSLPLTFTPRYAESGAVGFGEQMPVSDQVAAALHSTEHGTIGGSAPTLSLQAWLADADHAIASITSASHAIRTKHEGYGWRVDLADDVVATDKDLVIEWRYETKQDTQAFTYIESTGGDQYVMTLLNPPVMPKSIIPRDMTLVVDSSGSMSGTSMEQAKLASHQALDLLRSGDRFNVVDFDSETKPLWPTSRPVTPANLSEAHHFVERMDDDGGTNLDTALAFALQPPSDSSNHLRQIVLITDAAVGNEAELLKQIHDHLGNARLFPVGIGNAPNLYFVREAARMGRGTFRVIRNTNDVDAELTALFETIDRPALRDVAFDWPAGTEVFPKTIPDLYSGEPLMVVAKLPASASTIKATGKAGSLPWHKTINTQHNPRPSQGIARLFAREKIAALDDALMLGADEAAIKPQILDVALKHHLVSRYTSLVAIEKKRVRPEDKGLHSMKVENEPLEGFDFAQGALGGKERILIALLLTLLGLVIQRWKA